MKFRPMLACASLLAGTVVVLTGTVAQAAPTRYEAENSPATCAGTIDSNHSGFSGSGFCNGNNAVGAAAQFTVNASSAGTATLGVRFANGTTASRPSSVIVNGSTVQSTSFEGTGAWNSWSTKTLSVSVNAGSNTIRFNPTGSNGLPNIDYLDFEVGSNPPPPSGLVGWATQNGGTSGGAGGSTVTVSSASALSSALSSSSTQIIRVSGTISCSGMLRVASNKSVLGNSGATIAGCGLNISEARNVIVRNLTFRDWNDDAINVQYSTNVWVDHNSFTNGYDGAVDIKRASDFVTVSWNRFFNHGKTMLLGHSDGNGSEDRGRLRVSYHHNWFDGTNSRHPRVRFGNPVHVFNNYYDAVGDYGVASTMEGGVLVEGNFFENTDSPCELGQGSSPAGSLVQRNNHFASSGSCAASGGVNGIPYGYSLTTPSNVKSVVMNGAGAGRISV